VAFPFGVDCHALVYPFYGPPSAIACQRTALGATSDAYQLRQKLSRKCGPEEVQEDDRKMIDGHVGISRGVGLGTRDREGQGKGPDICKGLDGNIVHLTQEPIGNVL
jgi:hypothetical protein